MRSRRGSPGSVERAAGLRWDGPGLLTAINDDVAPALAGLPDDPVELCRVAQGLVMLPGLAPGFGIAEDRQQERSIRSASAILRRLIELENAPIEEPRAADRRVVGTCRHFALLSTAFLRHRSIPARARCGFAGYFVPDKYVDHWITEYHDGNRWVRVDAEILSFSFVEHPDDLAPGEFLTGGEAWTFLVEGGADALDFGVDGVAHAWGIAEVRGNAIRDLASLNKVETLPWDEWGRMTASYRGETGAEFDALVDVVAEACASDDAAVIEATYRSEDLTAPPELLA